MATEACCFGKSRTGPGHFSLLKAHARLLLRIAGNKSEAGGLAHRLVAPLEPWSAMSSMAKRLRLSFRSLTLSVETAFRCTRAAAYSRGWRIYGALCHVCGYWSYNPGMPRLWLWTRSPDRQRPARSSHTSRKPRCMRHPRVARVRPPPFSATRAVQMVKVCDVTLHNAEPFLLHYR